MQVRQIMSTPVVGVTGDATIEEAAALMLGRGFTTIPVFGESGDLIGMLSEADLGRSRFTVTRIEGGPDDGAMSGVTAHSVRQIMRRPSVVVPADAELTDVATVMVDEHVRCVPVVEGEAVIGIVSWRDLLASLILR